MSSSDNRSSVPDDDARVVSTAETTASTLPSSSKLPDAHRTQDLMSRLTSFLPQIQEANTKLEEMADQNNNNSRIDVDLCSEKSSSSEDSESDDDDDDGRNGDKLCAKKNGLIQELQDDTRKVPADERKRPAVAKPEESPDQNGTSNQTIQLSFALGDMTGNPMMDLLAAESDEKSEKDQEDTIVLEEEGSAAGRQAVKRLLDTISSSKSGSEVSDSRKNKKTLITEL